ncbi:EAL domain-containing protein [Enterovibrio sp. Hal110]
MDDVSKVKRDIFFLSIKESFISTVPYLVLSSIIVLINQFFILTGLQFYIVDSAMLTTIINYMNEFFPLMLMTSIAYHFSKRNNINNIFIITLSFSIFITVESIIHSANSRWLLHDAGVSFFVLVIPIFSVVLFNFIPKFETKMSLNNAQLSNVFYHLKSFILIYFLSLFMYLALLWVIDRSVAIIDLQLDLGLLTQMTLRTGFSQLLWFIGLHGPNTLSIVIPNINLETIFINNISYKAFYDIFVVYGGSGSGLSLILAALIYSKDKHISKVARLSFPFSIFNINEILIYGLPIVLNRYLLLPFVLVPILNIFIAYLYVGFFGINVVTNGVSWVTPVFVNAFMATGGDLGALLLQFVLLLLGVFIYSPFMKKYSLTQSSSNHLERLKNNLEMIELLEANEGVKSNQAESRIIKSNQEVEKIVNYISAKKLMVHYQPKVDVEKQRCSSFEALLRIKRDDGTISGPFFLESLELAGLASIIDLWVCREVRRHFHVWRLGAFSPKIAVNIHPDTLIDNNAIGQIIEELKGMNVEFEIIERDSIKDPRSLSNILRLHDNGFGISIDDFGVGYCSFEAITFLPVDTVKIDKSLIDVIDGEKGFYICKNILELCNDLGMDCVAEGVETELQYLKLKQMGFKYIQGYYFAKAMSFKQIQFFEPKFRRYDIHSETKESLI